MKGIDTGSSCGAASVHVFACGRHTRDKTDPSPRALATLAQGPGNPLRHRIHVTDALLNLLGTVRRYGPRSRILVEEPVPVCCEHGAGNWIDVVDDDYIGAAQMSAELRRGANYDRSFGNVSESLAEGLRPDT